MRPRRGSNPFSDRVSGGVQSAYRTWTIMVYSDMPGRSQRPVHWSDGAKGEHSPVVAKCPAHGSYPRQPRWRCLSSESPRRARIGSIHGLVAPPRFRVKVFWSFAVVNSDISCVGVRVVERSNGVSERRKMAGWVHVAERFWPERARRGNSRHRLCAGLILRCGWNADFHRLRKALELPRNIAQTLAQSAGHRTLLRSNQS